MKHASIVLTFFAMMLAAAATMRGQSLTVTLNVTGRPNPYVSEWASRRETAILTITNPGTAPVDAKIAVRILIGSTLQAESKVKELPVVTIPARTTRVYYGEDLVPFHAMKFYGGVETKSLRTGQLPAGAYSFCLRVLDAVTEQPLSPEICRPFTIVTYQAPRLLLPADKSTIRPEERPTFRWAPVTPNPPSPVRYQVRVMEVLPGQEPMQAFRGNQPIIERTVTGATQLLWLRDLEQPEPGMRYIWTVRALDENGAPIGERDGYAEPFLFEVTRTAGMRLGGNDLGVDSAGRSGSGTTRRGEGGSTTSGERRSGTGGEEAIGEGSTSTTRMSSGGPNTLIVSNDSVETEDDSINISNPQPPPSTCGAGTYACTAPACATLSTKSYAVGDTITICNFAMVLGAAPTGTTAALAGSGRIWVPWLRTNVAVEFSGIKVNNADQVCDGEIYATVADEPPTYPQQWGINVVGSFNWTKTQVKNLNTWIHANSPGRLKKLTDSLDLNQILAEQTAPPIEMPLGLNNLDGVTIAISELKFTPTGAALNCVAAFPVSDHNDTLCFIGANFPFSPSTPSVSSGKLGLLESVTFPISSGPSFEVTIRKVNGDSAGTFIAWDCKGFRELNVDLDVAFPRQWLIPIPDNGTDRVKANIVTNMVSWSDWLIQANLPKCSVAASNGLELEVQTMVYDHSDLRNAPDMAFPDNYTGDETEEFTGFYVKTARVILPDKLRTFSNPSQPVKVTCSDVIIDKLGVTGKVLGQNVVNFPNGNVSGLGASIDTVRVTLTNSSIVSAYMRGKIVLPVSEATTPNAIDYKALFNTTAGFQFTMQPANPIEAKLFAGAKLELAQTSTMTLAIAGGQTSFDLILNGEFEWDDVKIGNKVKVTMKDLAFQNMKVAYRETSGMSFEPGTWGFASPPKWIANFPVTIDNVKFAMKPKGAGEVLRGGLTFDVVLNLSENTISGRTALEATGAIEKPPGGKFMPKFIGVAVSEIEVHANLPSVKIDGKATFYNDDPTYGDGFSGSLKAIFNSAQIQIDAAARFGATEYQSPGNRFRYWGVEAKAILPKPGITFLPGVAFYGFAAGAWRRMNVANLPKPDLNAVAGATTASTSTTSGAVFTPNKNNGFGFKVMAVVGTSPDPKSMNADAALLGEFSTNGGLTKIAFTLDLWAAAGLLERNKAPVYGTATVQYVPPTKTFDLNALVHFKYPSDGSVVKSSGSGVSLKLNINGSTGLWYFKLGEPTSPNSVTVLNAFNVQEYLMFGNNIQAQTGFLPSTIQGLSQAGVSVGFQNQGISTQASLGQGFAAGITVYGSTGDKVVNLLYRTQLKYGAGGGFEINMSMLRYPATTLCSGNPLGLNGWYAQGGVAAWFYGYAGIQITNSPKPACDCCPKVWKDCCNPFKCCAVYCGSYYFNILDIKFGARLNGGFPRPHWVNGQVSGSYNVLGGLFSGSFTANLEIGAPCSIGQPEATATYAAEDAAATIETDGTLVIGINPAAGASGFPPDNPIGVVAGFKPDDAFEINERQADGTFKKRTFQARYTAKLDSLGPVVTLGSGGPPTTTMSTAKGAGPSLSTAPTTTTSTTKGGSSASTSPSSPSLSIMHVPTVIVLKRSGGPNSLGEYEYRIDRGVVPTIGQWTKNLDDNTRYKFTITGELWEKQGASWVKAKKRNGQEVSETAIRTFSTGVSPKIPLSGSSSSSSVGTGPTLGK